MERERVVACLSGGVDSSVAAALLVEAGHDVVGVFLRSGASGQAAGERQGCCSVEDALDARRVADALGIPFYALNMEREFGRLIDRFAADYAAGRTPNPCVLCNRWLKFGHVLAFADQVGAATVASGHYARVSDQGGRVVVRRARDRRKDQSYVLAVLEQAQLARVRFPLGERTKEEVRAMARARGLLRVADKPDSQELCFVPGDYREVLRERLPADAPALEAGEVRDTAGRPRGRHAGTAGYTVGQRRGLGIGGAGAPLYVVRTDPARRLVVVGGAADLEAGGLTADEVTWVGRRLAPGERARGRAQLRAHGAAHPATVVCTGPDAFEATFDLPARAVVPGQAAVVYDEADDAVLFAGWIRAAMPLAAGSPA
ncbi:MAG: tRNA 2-thiouridine(34) synthase MnmA [Planctomycetes bacterium]|nr:tRNA 2-thiouridine(34) synthase MnmA [Planctomycetota bacterium]